MTNRSPSPGEFDPFDEVLAEDLDPLNRLSASPAAIDRDRTERGEVEPRPSRPNRAKPNAKKKKAARRGAKPAPRTAAEAESSELDLTVLDSTDDELLDEISRPRRPRGEGGGMDPNAFLAAVFEVVITGLLIAVLVLFVGAVIALAGRGLGIVPGGPVNLIDLALGVRPTTAPNAAATLSGGAVALAATTAPAAATAAPIATSADALGADASGAAAVPPLASSAPLPTALPTCEQADRAAWWAGVDLAYRQFTAITPEVIASIENREAYLERLRLQREFIVNFQTPGIDEGCIASARAAALAYADAVIERVRILTELTGVDPNALNDSDARLAEAEFAITLTLWEVGALVEPESPPALALARGSGAACGAAEWYAQVEPIRADFAATAAQIDVVAMQPTTVRSLITEMQALAASADALPVPPCALVPNQLRAAIMTDQVLAFESLLRGQNAVADEAMARAEVAEARYALWKAWLS